MNFKTPAEIAEAAVGAAVNKAALSLPQMVIMGFLAGAYIAMGGFFMTVVTQDAAPVVGVGISKLLGGIVFALGLMLVVFAGGELFTGNCIMPIAILSHRVTLCGALRNLATVYAANFAGAVFFALMVFYSGSMSPACAANALSIAAAKTAIPVPQMIVRGILCNWLVALAVWMSFGAMDAAGKYITCLLPVSAFVAMGFEHSIANMYFITLGLLLKDSSTLPAEKLASLSGCGFASNLIYVTIGNILGAAFFVGVLYFAVYRKKLVK